MKRVRIILAQLQWESANPPHMHLLNLLIKDHCDEGARLRGQGIVTAFTRDPRNSSCEW